MYTQKLHLDDPEYHEGEFKGATAYARTKRMQVELCPLLGQRWAEDGIDVSVVDEEDEDGVVATLSHDQLPPMRALPSDAYEDRLRQAREAVKTDSKQVAQVVKDWVANDE